MHAAGEGISLVLELGAFKELSTRFLCERVPNVITIDHWKGSREHQRGWDCEKLYDQFIYNCWEYRKKLIPVREDTVKGMEILERSGVKPDLIYVDASHETKDVYRDLYWATKLFPEARVFGDDWTWEAVREGVPAFCSAQGYKTEEHYTCYEVIKCQ